MVKLIKKIIRKIIDLINKFFILFKVIIYNLLYKNKIFLFGVPIHGNLGDQAILYGEEKFLKDNLKDIKIIEVESSIVKRFSKLLKKIVKDSLILIHGGGFLGSLWINEEEMFRKTLKTFPNNTIIVFPQTIFFSKDEEGQQILQESKKIYQTHKNLYICCREEYSYNFMKEEFEDCKILLVPDMVLYLDKLEENKKRENVLFCIRKDKEKVNYNFDKLENTLKNKDKFLIDYTDTVINKNIYTLKTRKKELNKKIHQFQNYKMVVTDRLHGMVFAYLSNTKCLVLQNKSYKVKGVYEWIKDANHIMLAENDNMLELSDKLMNIKENRETHNLKDKYNVLVQLIKNNKGNNSKKGE